METAATERVRDRGTVERFAFSPSEAAAALGLSRPTVYQLMRRADFPSFKVGSRTLSSAEGLREWVQRQTERGDADGE